MNLQEAMMELHEKDNLIGVFQELVAHLDRIEKADEKIPIYNSTEEFVDAGYIDEVRRVLGGQIQGLTAERKKILDWEVSGAEEDPSGDGPPSRRGPSD
jgi:hypothetical protein